MVVLALTPLPPRIPAQQPAAVFQLIRGQRRIQFYRETAHGMISHNSRYGSVKISMADRIGLS